MRVSIRRLAMACAMLLMPTAPGYSQETTGTILGALVDQTGGVLPGVKVVMTHVDTGHIREVVTNSVGQYTANVPIGTYEISFQFPNFQAFVTRGITLHVNDRLQVNGTLRVGAVETLTVTAERLVQPTSDVRNLIPRVAVEELPLLTRTFVQVVTLVPGVSSDLREDACFCYQGNLDVSFNGGRRSGVNWLLDGASDVNVWNNYTLVTTPSLEAIQEINVITSSYSAEWARNGGGVVNAVTRSGTSRFSGSAYEFVRNDVLNANRFFRNMSTNPDINSTPPRLRYNNFGYTLGGPALPSRKKLFFFFSEEWRVSSRNEFSAEGRVPDPAWLTDPSSSNYVPPEARDPNAVKLLALWPTPNVPGTNRYRTMLTNELDTRQEFVRADYNVNSNWSVVGRYLRDRVDSHGGYPTGPEAAPGHLYTVGHLAVVEARRVGGRLLLESSYQLSSHLLSRNDFSQTRGDLGILIPELFPENVAGLIPNIEIPGVISLVGSQPWPREYLNHTFSSAVTRQYGTHALKTGGLFALEDANSNLFQETTQGSFTFVSEGGFTAFQHFLRGNSGGECQSCSYSETDIDPLNHFRTRRYEVFIQDTWRMHPNVTLDLGLRYAYYSPLQDDGNMLFTFSPDAYDPGQAPTFANSFGDLVIVGTGDLFNGLRVAGMDSPYGRAIYGSDTNNLQPRAGVAWDPRGDGKLIGRAGYGMYFDQTQVGMFAQNMQQSFYNPFVTQRSIRNPALSNPSVGTVIPTFVVATPAAFATSDPFVAPRWQHWNIGAQRRLYSGGVIDLGYVGSRGDHLPRFVDINQPQPEDVAAVGGDRANLVRPFRGYSSIVMRETTATSHSHGFLASFRHDAGRGLWGIVNYTFSRTMADATYDNSVLDLPQNPLEKDAEFAAALTDRTHIFTASYVYELPFARDETGWRNALLQGWQITGITRIESGPAARFLGPLRPNQVGDPAEGDQTGLLWFDPTAFAPPPAGEYGDAPVVSFRLPGRYQWDFAVSKNVRLGSTTRLQLRADLINAFNQTQFLDVNTTCVGTTACTGNSSLFGRVTSTRPPREIQLGVRFNW